MSRKKKNSNYNKNSFQTTVKQVCKKRQTDCFLKTHQLLGPCASYSQGLLNYISSNKVFQLLKSTVFGGEGRSEAWNTSAHTKKSWWIFFLYYNFCSVNSHIHVLDLSQQVKLKAKFILQGWILFPHGFYCWNLLIAVVKLLTAAAVDTWL